MGVEYGPDHHVQPIAEMGMLAHLLGPQPVVPLIREYSIQTLVVLVALVTLLAVPHAALRKPHCCTQTQPAYGGLPPGIELGPLQDTHRMIPGRQSVRLKAGPGIHCRIRHGRQRLQLL
jgi:hypothetical protein